MGLSGNLTTGEILEQIVHADRILAQEWQDLNKKAAAAAAADPDQQQQQQLPKLDLVRNVVFMGMGEVRWFQWTFLKEFLGLRKRSLCFVVEVVTHPFFHRQQPLDNYKNVVEACRALIDNKRWSKLPAVVSRLVRATSW